MADPYVPEDDVQIYYFLQHLHMKEIQKGEYSSRIQFGDLYPDMFDGRVKIVMEHYIDPNDELSGGHTRPFRLETTDGRDALVCVIEDHEAQEMIEFLRIQGHTGLFLQNISIGEVLTETHIFNIVNPQDNVTITLFAESQSFTFDRKQILDLVDLKNEILFRKDLDALANAVNAADATEEKILYTLDQLLDRAEYNFGSACVAGTPDVFVLEPIRDEIIDRVVSRDGISPPVDPAELFLNLDVKDPGWIAFSNFEQAVAFLSERGLGTAYGVSQVPFNYFLNRCVELGEGGSPNGLDVYMFYNNFHLTKDRIAKFSSRCNENRYNKEQAADVRSQQRVNRPEPQLLETQYPELFNIALQFPWVADLRIDNDANDGDLFLSVTVIGKVEEPTDEQLAALQAEVSKVYPGIRIERQFGESFWTRVREIADGQDPQEPQQGREPDR